MKRIIYIPLDERPCNYNYPQHLANTRNDIELIVPPKRMLGNKKEAANIGEIWNFVFEKATKADGFVLSSEMLVYGGLLPSRLHYLTKDEKQKRIDNFRKLRKKNNNKPIYISALIMRTPKFSTSDEEPDYYGYYGKEIFTRSYLTDKKNRIGLNEQEEVELNKVGSSTPTSYITDYENRRAFNLNVNIQLLDLIKEGVIDFLSIPQDDSALYGYTAQDQDIVYRNISKKNLRTKVLVYPGADEVGCTLVARMLNQLLHRRPLIHYFYSSTNGPHIVPLYEDRPLNESVKAHILASGCQISSSASNADFILAINSPGELMEEASEQKIKDFTYNSYRQLNFFAEQIYSWIQEENKPLVVADSAFANGGDQELIELLDEYNLLDKLISYKGWNTNCNTLGTTIAAGIFGFERNNELKIKKNLLYNLFDDVFYQSKIRKEVTHQLLPSLNANYFNLNQQDQKVENEIKQKIIVEYKKKINNSFRNINISQFKVVSPWSRMFEISIEFYATTKYEKGG